jgi:N-acetylglucosaminyldiphosphoundecaprenol N-acetyl-beta-D-mannosaminyltransferase
VETISEKVTVGITTVEQRVDVLGVAIDNLSMPDVLERIGEFVEEGRFTYAVTPNVDHLVKLRRDVRFRQIYAKADLVVADGVPLLWASRMLGAPLKERINGTDLFELTCELAARRGYSVYLLGGSPGAAQSACERLREKHPDLKIAGWCCPPHGFHEDEAQNESIRKDILRTGANILFVGLGAPKQENWMHSYAKRTGVAFAIGVGVSFSFVSGEIARAPVWMQRHGFEWLWRLINEPRRLWKRYLIDDIAFLGLLVTALARRCLRNTDRSRPTAPDKSEPPILR